MQQLNRDGVALYYDEAGSGDPPILFIHGGMADHTHFAPQFEHFSRDHRTVVVDLRGHGQSDKPKQDYTITGFADDIVWMCNELGISKPVVVGHSMGGLIALELAAHFADLPAAIVILDSPVVPPQEFYEALKPFVEALRTPGYREAIRQFLEQFIGFADNPERRARLMDDLSSVPQHVIASALESYLAFDTAEAASAIKVPIFYISSGPWFTDVTRFHELCPKLVTGQTVGSGHYHQLEVPEQINAMIDRFLTINLLHPA
ncbi:MAG: alpha/beta hydrolase [Bacteroidetes bacterium]|nr:alpha/beta hydrolase [Bacteroidota bacterium]